MDNTFILNPSLDELDLKDATDERLIKARGIAHCLLANINNEARLNNEFIHAVVWLLQGLIDEFDYLYKMLDNNKK